MEAQTAPPSGAAAAAAVADNDDDPLANTQAATASDAVAAPPNSGAAAEEEADDAAGAAKEAAFLAELTAAEAEVAEAEAQAEEDLKPKEVRMSQRTSKYMYRQRKEKNLYQATRNVDKLVVNNLQSETVDELVSASLQVLDEQFPEDAREVGDGDYKLALQLKTAEATSLLTNDG